MDTILYGAKSRIGCVMTKGTDNNGVTQDPSTSAHNWWTNQFGMLLSGLAYSLVEAIRRLALQGTALAKAQCEIKTAVTPTRGENLRADTLETHPSPCGASRRRPVGYAGHRWRADLK